MTTKIQNVTAGPRGYWDNDTLKWMGAGEVREVDMTAADIKALPPENFKVFGDTVPVVAPTEPVMPKEPPAPEPAPVVPAPVAAVPPAPGAAAVPPAPAPAATEPAKAK